VDLLVGRAKTTKSQQFERERKDGFEWKDSKHEKGGLGEWYDNIGELVVRNESLPC